MSEMQPDRFDGLPSPAELRTIVREVLAEVLADQPDKPEVSSVPSDRPASPHRPGGHPRDGNGLAMPVPREQAVRLHTSEDLRSFVLHLVELAADPARRQDILNGRLRFRLEPPLGAAEAAVHRLDKGAVTERAVRAAARDHARLVLGRRAVLTPLARDA
ncbi:MAG TPA: hypothetical protein VGQ26_05290, partial [Streptosporangiaceae bacterium]|nr:hypothetical protein [Streptosporangiaceae bacterium]